MPDSNDLYLIYNMNPKDCYCVIMAGGSGTRFWPVSRNSRPKQFLDMADTGKTFLRLTYERFLNIIPKENIIVVTAAKYKEMLLEQIPEISEENLLLEPYAKNTAPCIAYATYSILKRNPQARVVVTPSDHIIENEGLFSQTITEALEYLKDTDALMSLGVVPTRPETNYGYAQIPGGMKAFKEGRPMKVKTFIEKPEKSLAEILISSGEFFWNSGIFIWKASTIKEEMETYIPEITGFFRGWETAIGSKIEDEFIKRAYTECLKISIDYGVMEKTEKSWLYPVNFGWTDISTWESLYNWTPLKDEHNNTTNVEKLMIDKTSSSLVISTDPGKMIAIKGLEEFMVIDTEDVLLICPKDDRKFKEFISRLGMPEFEKYR